MAEPGPSPRFNPAETAPRDGRRFWGIVGDDAIAMFFHTGFGEFVSSFNRMTLARGMTFADTGLNFSDHSPVICRPTAWMEIPAEIVAASHGASHG